jgi:bloom syndrome protein
MIPAHFNERFDPHLYPKGCHNCSKGGMIVLFFLFFWWNGKQDWQLTRSAPERTGGVIVLQQYTSEAQQAIRLFEQMTASMDSIPVGHFKDVFAGRNKAKVRDSGHDQLSLFGVGESVYGDRIIGMMMDTDIFTIAREASASG